MKDMFCKKSVFGIVFFVFFFLGTICGVLLFRFFAADHAPWLRTYCLSLSSAARPSLWRWGFFLLWPLLAALALGLSSGGRRLLPFLCALRGCTLSYFASAFFASGLMLDGIFLRELILLPVFFFLCVTLCAEGPCS